MPNDRYPRTMKEAFGPYTSSKIEEAGMPFDKADAIVICGSAIAAVAIVVLCLFGVIPW